jgi:ribosomal protein S18 acetylase RimI-like enzyme
MIEGISMKILIKESKDWNEISLKLIDSSSTEYSDVPDYFYYHILADGIKVGDMSILDHFDSDYNDICYVERIDIDDDWQNKGIGTEVLTKTIREELDYYYIVLAPDNTDAQRLYARIGDETTHAGGCDFDFGELDQGYGVYII